MEKAKQLPYGISNFETIRTQNYAYVDKTRFIELLEKESNPYQFFIRPRKFGKSLFFSTLSNYYDINTVNKFQQLFGDLYIGQHPTPEKNKCVILKFNFSGINTASKEGFASSFENVVQQSVCSCLKIYENVFTDADELIRQINENKLGIQALRVIYSATQNTGQRLFVIIDEYDHFANDLIAMGSRMGEDIYRRMVRANGLVRDFYETLKIGTSDVVNHIFITGISPVMLDDLTSGFNIASNLSLDLRYNEMMGFTQAEVDALMIETGVNPDYINVDMKAYYDGYLFHQDGGNRVYNPSMVLYFFNNILKEKKAPQNILDENLKTDYGRLQRLATNDKNRQTLIEILKEDGIVTTIVPKFSIDRLYDDEYFVSLLFYMGLLTIQEPDFMQVRLAIPNYSIQTIFWEYFRLLMQENSPEVIVEVQPLINSIKGMAMEGDIFGYIDYVSKNAFAKLSDRDLRNFDEKYIQILLLAYLFQSKIYIPMSEYEAVPGFADIFLQRNPDLPQIKYEWILEIKYLKTEEATKVPQKMEEAKEQLDKYLHAFRLAGRPGLYGAAIVFVGKNKFELFIQEPV
ncbi:MAG: ATP-binding protein [Candidatus Symbiothrix sp.]|jgi:hypothetical protein|nr:ATP-binding protein [Candidatus Symbiothrix sp.]